MSAKFYAMPLVTAPLSGGTTLAYSKDNLSSTQGIRYDAISASTILIPINNMHRVFALPAEACDLFLIPTCHPDIIVTATNKTFNSPVNARSIPARLTVKSIDPTRIKIVGKGEAEPIALCGSLAGSARNRGIEFEAGK